MFTWKNFLEVLEELNELAPVISKLHKVGVSPLLLIIFSYVSGSQRVVSPKVGSILVEGEFARYCWPVEE